eukprot:gene29082-32292_t
MQQLCRTRGATHLRPRPSLASPSPRPTRFPTLSTRAAATAPMTISETSQLAQLAKMTVLSIDTGDLSVIKQWASSGVITDATTNPLFISQAAARGDEPQYASLVDEAVKAAKKGHSGSHSAVPAHASGAPSADSINLAIDHLSVNLGKEILSLVPGYVSTAPSETRGRRIIELYEAAGVSRERVLIKLAGTWEGIQAAKALEKDGISCNITLATATLISPFPGRVLEWTKADNPSGPQSFAPEADPGVVACRRMYSYFRKHGHNTICMPASWRSSTGNDLLDEIRGLAGTDRMTMPPALLEKLAADEDPLPRLLSPGADGSAASCTDGDEPLSEAAYRYQLSMDGAANDKLAAGIRAFAGDTARLVSVLEAHPGWQ